jgi:hypothetical protein
MAGNAKEFLLLPYVVSVVYLNSLWEFMNWRNGGGGAEPFQERRADLATSGILPYLLWLDTEGTPNLY